MWSGSLGELVIVPTVELPPTTPFTSQVTLVSCVPVTAAAKGCDWPSATLADTGATVTVTVELMVTASEAAFDGSASGLPTMLTVAGEGADAGAV